MSEDYSNPLENADVKSLLKEADGINSKHDFKNWQKSFLDVFTRFLDSDGSDKANAAYEQFRQSSGGLFKIVKSLTKHMDEGTLSKDRTSVKARRAITELGTVLGKLVEALDLILPTTSFQIKKFGFTKYHMGAVLVEDGFQEYAVMQFCKTILRHLRQQMLEEVASQQVLEEIDYFGKKFDSFCGVMESLNMMNVCKIAEKFLHAELLEETGRIVDNSDTPAPATPVASDPLPEKTKEITFSIVNPGTSKSALKNTPPKNAPSKVANQGRKDDNSLSSYEEIEETITVSTYETVEVDDESSYETLEIIESSEYETDEEEVVVSDYVTDSDQSDSDAKRKKKDKKKKNRGPKPVAQKKGGNNNESPANKATALPWDKPAGGGDSLEPRSLATGSRNLPPQNTGQAPPSYMGNNDEDAEDKNSEDDDEPDSNNSSDEEKKHDGKHTYNDASDSESSGQGNIKPKAAVAPNSLPPSPTANEKPVERIQFSAKDFYHGHGSSDCFNLWKQFKNEKDSGDKDKEERRRKRIERREVVARRRKVKDRETRTVRQKKEKPPKVIRVRRTRQVIQKKLVKKQ